MVRSQELTAGPAESELAYDRGFLPLTSTITAALSLVDLLAFILYLFSL